MSTETQGAAPTPEEVLRLANIQYFRSRAFTRTSWMGVPAMKCPMDLWIYQELISALGVDLLIETGTAAGGSALYFAHLFELLGRGQVLSIDIRPDERRPRHPRLRYLTGSSLSRAVLDEVAQQAALSRCCMAVLDSDHRAPFKLLELEAYAPFVSPGSYLIAEDSAFDHYPAYPEYGSGPAKAVMAFLASHPEFSADREQERHLLSFAPQAFLRRAPAP